MSLALAYRTFPHRGLQQPSVKTFLPAMIARHLRVRAQIASLRQKFKTFMKDSQLLYCALFRSYFQCEVFFASYQTLSGSNDYVGIVPVSLRFENLQIKTLYPTVGFELGCPSTKARCSIPIRCIRCSAIVQKLENGYCRALLPRLLSDPPAFNRPPEQSIGINLEACSFSFITSDDRKVSFYGK